jgi:hypothetical protein
MSPSCDSTNSTPASRPNSMDASLGELREYALNAARYTTESLQSGKSDRQAILEAHIARTAHKRHE